MAIDPEGVYERLINRAAAQLGGTGALAQRLHVPQEKLEGWVAGRDTPDMPMVLRMLEIVLDG